jgi:hypothetical protein
MAAGDRLRQQYQGLSADPGSLANLDQDLPNNMQNIIPIVSCPPSLRSTFSSDVRWSSVLSRRELALVRDVVQ